VLSKTITALSPTPRAARCCPATTGETPRLRLLRELARRGTIAAVAEALS